MERSIRQVTSTNVGVILFYIGYVIH